MATKLFKRSSAPDVFEQIVDEADPAPAEAAESSEDTCDSESSTKGGVDEQKPEPGGSRLRFTALTTAAVILVAALCASAFLGWQYRQHAAVSAASSAALETAKSYAVTLTSMDTEGIDDNFHLVLDGATGEFKDMYSQSAGQLRQVLVDNKAMSKGMVVDAAVKSASTDKVEVLLFVDQSITNLANPQPRLDRSRVDMTMERIDGRWLASSVELK